jgi:TPP-dependent pyruvate/acetoin dehydrogenase alpha subunit
VEDPVQEQKEHLREAAATDTEELKEAVEEFKTAAQNDAREAVKTGWWASLYAAFAVGLFFGLRKPVSGVAPPP